MIYTTRTAWGGPDAAPGHPMPGPVSLVVIHHSYRPHRECGVPLQRERDDVLGMHRYHAGLEWGGISYQWLVFQSGNIYEGRGWGRTGAHTKGQNSRSLAICLVIDGDKHAPTAAALAAVHEIIAEGVRLGRIAREHRLAPHDEFTPKDCPGVLVKRALRLGGFGPASRPVLKLGSRSAAVASVQRILGVKPESGYFGAATHAAVLAFQREHGLQADGVVGPATWTELLGAGGGG